MKKYSIFILLMFLIESCVPHAYIGPTYISKPQNRPFENEYQVLQLDYVNSFHYIYYNKAGTIHEEVNGDYKIIKDSLILEIIKPIDVQMKKSFVEYSNCGFQDSLYLIFFKLFPEILQVNRHRYQKASLSLFYECPVDTCPSLQAIESNRIPSCDFNDTVIVSRKLYASNYIDTLNFFDPNDDLIDKKMQINMERYNCAKIYLAVKPKYELQEIPTRLSFKGKNIVYTDSNNNLIKFKPYDKKFIIK